MLLETLRVQNFGHFDNQELSVPQGTRFVILYGENGTGKTTLLNSFRSVLFGIEERTPYAEGKGESPVLTAVLHDSAGARLEVTRYKRRKATLNGIKLDNHVTGTPNSTTLDEVSFALCLGPSDRKLYEAVFGFTLQDLENGAKVLKDATVGQLLAGGALGGSADQVRELLTNITAKTDALFRPQSQRQINKRKSRLDTLLTERNRERLTDTNYDRLQTRLRSCIAEINGLQQEIKIQVEAEAELGRLITAYPHWERLCEREAELEAASHASIQTRVSGTQAIQIKQHLASLAEAYSKCTELRHEASLIELRVSEYSPEEPLLLRGTVIDRLMPQVDIMARLRSSLPMDIQEQQHSRDSLERWLASLFPAVGWETIEEEVILSRHLAEVERLYHELQRIEAERKQHLFHLAEKEIAREKEQRRIDEAALSSSLPQDLLTLLPLLDQRKQLCRDWEQTDEALRQRSAEIETRMTRLRPPLPNNIELAHYSLPPAAAVRHLTDRRRELMVRLEEDSRVRSDAHRRLAEAEAALQSLHTDLPTPLPGSVIEARLLRDQIFHDWELSDHDASGRFAYVEAVAKADALADRLVESAERVARLAEMRREVNVRTADLSARDVAILATNAGLESWREAWESFWQEASIILPRSRTNSVDSADIELMIAWRDEVAKLQETATEIAQLESNCEQQLKTLIPFEARLRAAFPEVPATPLSELITLLEDRANRSREAAAIRHSCIDRVASLQQEIIRHEADIAELNAAKDLVTLTGQEYLLRIGIPIETSLTSSVDLLKGLREISSQKAKWQEQQRVLDLHSQELAGYDTTIEEIRAVLATGNADPANNEDFILELGKRLQQARTTQALYQDRLDQLAIMRTRLSRAEEALHALEVERDRWLLDAGVQSESELAEIARSVERRVALHHEHTHARSLFEAALGNGISSSSIKNGEVRDAIPDPTIDPIVARMRSTSVESLQDERRHLRESIGSKRDKLSDAQINLGTLQQEAQQRGGPEAALKAAEYEEERSALQDEMQEYVVQFLAGRVLQNVVERYARENQPELLRVASSLIAQITDGQYIAVRQSSDERITERQSPGENTLVLIPAGNPSASRTPERLSTGEREQMFLALRLAFVTHYCASYEPLPIILDDVLVNFDERRAAATLRTLGEVAQTTQVLFFTCHKDLRDLALASVPGAIVCDLPPLKSN